MTQKAPVNQLLRRAQAALQAGRADDAKSLLESLLAKAPGHFDALHQMGVIARAEKNPVLAIGYLKRALDIDDRRADLWLNLASSQEDVGERTAALDSLRRAVALRPDFAEAWNNMGLLQRDLGQPREAEQAFRNAIRCRPEYARGHNNLGILLREQGQQDQAQHCFEQAARLQPNDLAAHFNAGTNLQYLGRPGEAERFFQAALNINPRFVAGWERLAETYRLVGRLEDAEKVLRHALTLMGSVTAEHLNNLARILAEQGRGEEAAATYAQAAAMEPDNLRAALGAALTLSPIYPDAGAITAARQRYAEGLDRLCAQPERFLAAPAGRILDTLARTNFNLAYHGEDDLPLQERYAGFVHALLARILPDLAVPPAAAGRTGRKPRVGFLSRHFFECTVGKYFRSWVTDLDRDLVDVHVYHLNEKVDGLTHLVRAAAAGFRHLPVGRVAVPDIARAVRQDELDVLIYPELGMDQTCFLLAALRLAPVQCVAWGHPVTTGHRTIDYFLSCATMEPPDAQDQYTERLVLLPGLGTNYAMPVAPADGTRAAFSLPEDKTLYLCQQSLFKIHSDNDDLLTLLAARDPDALLVFFVAERPAMTEQFVARLGRAFARRGLDPAGRVRLLPRMGHADYMRVTGLCDVMVDTLRWSGGNSSLDALACGLPVVTLPGRFMRGRQTYGMLTAMGMDELIAGDRDAFLDIALRVGRDGAYRQALSDRIRSTRGLLFGRLDAVQALQSFLLEVVRAGPPD